MKYSINRKRYQWLAIGLGGAGLAFACGSQRVNADGATTEDDMSTVDADADADADGSEDADGPVDAVDRNDATCSAFTAPRKNTLGDGNHPDAVSLLSVMTLDEKIASLSGGDVCPNYDCDFDGTGVPSQNIKDFRMRDGPRGVHTHNGDLGTSFAVAMARAASFDVELEHAVGEVQGKEMLALQYDLALAPTINNLRHPGWARAQETYGEDPVLLGEMGAAFTNGIQLHVPACPKHFAGNNTDENRTSMIAQMDEQTLREQYTRAFQITIEKSDPACIMAAYNGVNGEFSAENTHLLTDILRTDWGWGGFVVSDWWATKENGVKSLNSGLDMEMPDKRAFEDIPGAVTGGTVSADRINEAALRIFNARAIWGQLDENYPVGAPNPNITDEASHRAVAYQTAVDGAVLLENKEAILPITAEKVKSIVILGPDRHLPVAETNISGTSHGMGDRGSSNTNPPYAVSYVAGITSRASAAGITVTDSANAADAATADLVIIPVTMAHEDEGEAFGGGGDRDNLGLAANHPEHWDQKPSAFINAAAAANPNVVVLLAVGAAVVMEDWASNAKGIVHSFYGGQEAGNAIASLLFGAENFSAKLPFTVATDPSHYPTFGNTVQGTVNYDYLHGYRKFEAEGLTPRYWFGYGQSYTTFKYEDLDILCDSVAAGGRLNVNIKVTNTGTVPGREVVHAYVGFPNTTARRPVKELKEFKKTKLLAPGESEVVQFNIAVKDTAYWGDNGWVVETGVEHEIIVAASANPQEVNLLKGTFTPN